MNKIAKVVTLPSNINLDMEDVTINQLIPLLKEAIYPGTAVLPNRHVIIIIEVLETPYD